MLLIVSGAILLGIAMLFQVDPTSLEAGVVPIIVGVASATTTGYLVGFFKKAYPAAPDRAIVAVAIAAGLFSASVVSMVNGGIHLTQIGIGTIILQGLGAAALSAGVQVVNKPPTIT